VMVSRRRLLAIVVAALAVWVASFGAPALAAGKSAAPRVKYAIALDANGNDHVDGLRLVYDQPVRHTLDTSGAYPFSVDDYTVTGVGAAKGRHIDLMLAEHSGAPDIQARPSVTYIPTSAQPVLSTTGVQAVAQTVTTIVSLDSDGDGFTVADGDCNDADPAVHPGAADLPDLAQLDSNCDGIDGTIANSVFVSSTGNDGNPGTMSAPKLTINAAIATAASYVPAREVLVAAGRYDQPGGLALHSGVGVYGGYVGDGWELRAGSNATVVTGSPQAALADGATGVTLQLLTLRGSADETRGADPSVYGLRAVNGSHVRIENVTVTAGDARNGAVGSPGQNGVSAPAAADRSAGAPGTMSGSASGVASPCPAGPAGGMGMTGPGYPGGAGGTGGVCGTTTGAGGGAGGGPSGILAPGGVGGAAGSFGSAVAGGNGAGGAGFTGVSGDAGAPGSGGSDGFDSAGPAWNGSSGGTGGNGGPGGGGGGGGGGSAWVCPCSPTTYLGGGGGGGGAGGAGGLGGGGGSAGGGSFAVYLWNSSVAITNSSLTAGNGGDGGSGGAQGSGGDGGAGGLGGASLLFGFGAGGPGGAGGSGGVGGGGGGGAGGPSVGIFRGGTSTSSVDDGTLILFGVGGLGGTSASGVQWDGATGRAASLLP